MYTVVLSTRFCLAPTSSSPSRMSTPTAPWLCALRLGTSPPSDISVTSRVPAPMASSRPTNSGTPGYAPNTGAMVSSPSADQIAEAQAADEFGYDGAHFCTSPGAASPAASRSRLAL